VRRLGDAGSRLRRTRVDQRRPHHAPPASAATVLLDGHYDGQILRYDYSFGDFAVAISVEQDDNNTDR
jgi:hypothetical protein